MGLPIALRAGEPKLAVMSACLTCGVCRLAGYVILCFLTAVNNFTCLCRLTKHETPFLHVSRTHRSPGPDERTLMRAMSSAHSVACPCPPETHANQMPMRTQP
jgi:hypothetical protein